LGFFEKAYAGRIFTRPKHVKRRNSSQGSMQNRKIIHQAFFYFIGSCRGTTFSFTDVSVLAHSLPSAYRTVLIINTQSTVPKAYLTERTSKPDSTAVVGDYTVSLVSWFDITAAVAAAAAAIEFIVFNPLQTAFLQTEHSTCLSASTTSRRTLNETKRTQSSPSR